MPDQERFLVDVGLRDLELPVNVSSRARSEGQPTVATISVTARIMRSFAARWIETFRRIAHKQNKILLPHALQQVLVDYLAELEANVVQVHFEFPFFYEKPTPASHEESIVRYRCRYSAKAATTQWVPRIRQRLEIPVLTTYPGSVPEKEGGLLAQLTFVDCEFEAGDKEVFPEDIVDLVDRHALMPVYSFLAAEDQAAVIEKVHSEGKSSVVMLDEIQDELARNRLISWYSVRCRNFGMLHSYSTFIATEKSMWVPLSTYEQDEI